MIVIGADTHKSSYALAPVDADTGVGVGELETKADEDGHRRALRCARGLAAQTVWALEDCRGVSGRLERALVSAGDTFCPSRRR